MATITRTYDACADANRWADEPEGKISAETYLDRSEAKGTKLRELLTQCRQQAAPTMKGADREAPRSML